VLDRVVGTLDLTALSAGVKAFEGEAGRSTLSPRMQLTLWLYGISRGIGSAREIARLTTSDDAFRWVVGDLKVSHHTLSSFRVSHEQALDELMTNVLAGLVHKGLLSLDLVAQDGTRVRASASAPSFRTYGSLQECRRQAELHLKAVLADADNPERTVAQQAAREAGARDFQRRVGEAIEAVTALQAERGPAAKFARASNTDAEARVMKMPDVGFRPGYNPEVAAWRQRMVTEEAKRLYRARAGLVELTNAHVKSRFGIEQVLVRGLAKVRCVALLAGLAFNLLQNAERLLT